MGRILAIDYGTKRTGIAVTDTLQIIATALTTVPSHTIFDYLKDYLVKEQVECIVVGIPKRLNNSSSETTEKVYHFINKLQQIYPDLKIYKIDERFTSKIAQQSIIQNGLSKKQRSDKSLIDQVSATILLQDYLTQIKNK